MNYQPSAPRLVRPELQRLATVAVKGHRLRYRHHRTFPLTTATLIEAVTSSEAYWAKAQLTAAVKAR